MVLNMQLHQAINLIRFLSFYFDRENPSDFPVRLWAFISPLNNTFFLTCCSLERWNNWKFNLYTWKSIYCKHLFFILYFCCLFFPFWSFAFILRHFYAVTVLREKKLLELKWNKLWQADNNRLHINNKRTPSGMLVF